MKHNFRIRVVSGIFAIFATIYLGGQIISIVGIFGGFANYLSNIRNIIVNLSYYWVFGNLFGIASMLLFVIYIFAFNMKNKAAILGISIALFIWMQIIHAIRFVKSITNNYPIFGNIENTMLATIGSIVSLRRHEEWLKTISCPVLRINNISFEDSVKSVLDTIRE